MAVFNREDGQLAFGSKTPVSILQEILHKKGMTPHYELIYNGVGTNEPLFKFRVSAEGMTAIGDGKSKKEAKHDAAATLLKRMLANKVEVEDTDSKEGVDIASPYTGALKSNYVGTLDEICFCNKIPPPNYILVREEGPPHARVFTMKCIISSISEIAVARTKKQAKHLVAQKMIDRVTKILKDRYVPALGDSEAPEENISDREKILNGSFNHDLTYRVRDLHNVFHIQKDEQQPLPTIFQELPEKSEEYYESMENPQEFLEEVVEALEGVVKANVTTVEKFKEASFELLGFFEDELECSEYKGECETQCEPDVMSRVNIDNILPDYPLSDTEEEKESDKSDTKLKKSDDFDDFSIKSELTTDNIRTGIRLLSLSNSEEKNETEVRKLNKNDISEDLLNSPDIAYSFLQVEVPRGLWSFVGRGKSDEEALKDAARQAIKFLRLLAVPPPENYV